MKLSKKIDNIVKSISSTTSGGNIFFDKIDSEIKKPENIDIIFGLFQNIYNDFGPNFNLVISGGFGDLILYLIKEKKIICKGTILHVSGGLTSHFTDMDKIKKVKEVNIEKQIGRIDNKNFIFVDDSYYSGTTGVSINLFLNKFKSKIIKTYVAYDGNDKKSSDRLSIYNYYDWNQGSKRTIDELIEELSKYDDIPINTFQNKIFNGEITSIIQLRKEINAFKIKAGQKGIDVYTRLREGLIYLMDFKKFNK